MARNDSDLAKMIPLVIGVAVVGGVTGYFWIGGASKPAAAPTTVQVTAPAAVPHAAVPKQKTAAVPENSDYTAPGSPRIQIREERVPVLTDGSGSAKIIPSPTPTAADSEASQEDSGKSNLAVPDSATSQSNDTPPASPPASDTAADNTDSATPSNDPDSETVTHTDTEASQQGTAPDKPGAYRVQIGAFTQNKNARVLADALHNRGYSTSLREEPSGDHSVYKVQAGTYRTRAAASKAALELQRDGFPASVAP